MTQSIAPQGLTLLLPATSNHNQTIFLLALVLEYKFPAQLLQISTDPVADKLIARVATQLGVSLIPEQDLINFKYDLMLSHSWNRHERALASLSGVPLAFYADGLSNRMMIPTGESFSKAVLWGAEMFESDRAPSVAGAQETLTVSNNSIRKIWEMVALAAGGKEEASRPFGRANSVLLAFRYWGAHTYSGVTLDALENYLKSVIGQTPEDLPIEIAEDSRWTLPIGQKQIVQSIFPEREISIFRHSHTLRTKFGHLTNLDLVAYNGLSRHKFLAGFDGSVPLTFSLAQKQVQVLTPTVEFRLGASIGKVIRENFAFHEAAIHGIADASDHANLFSSIPLKDSLQVTSRNQGSVEEFGQVVKALAENYLGGTSLDVITRTFARENQRWAKRKKLIAKFESFKSSELAQKVYFVSIKYPLLRRLVRRLGRLL